MGQDRLIQNVCSSLHTENVEQTCEGSAEELDSDEVRRSQKLVGPLIWLSTRTRPDVAYAQSRISSTATKAPKQALRDGFGFSVILQERLILDLVFRHATTRTRLLRTPMQILRWSVHKQARLLSWERTSLRGVHRSSQEAPPM